MSPLTRGILIIALLLSSCATPTRSPEPDPVQAITGWYEALRDGKPEVAYLYLDAKARAEIDYKTFKDLYRKHKPFLVAEARDLLRWARAHSPNQTATVTFGKQRVRLVKTPAGWRILTPIRVKRRAQ